MNISGQEGPGIIKKYTSCTKWNSLFSLKFNKGLYIQGSLIKFRGMRYTIIENCCISVYITNKRMFIFIFITIIRPIKKSVSNSVKNDSQKMGNHSKAWKYDKHVKTAACVICAVTLALPKIFIGLFTLHSEEK